MNPTQSISNRLQPWLVAFLAAVWTSIAPGRSLAQSTPNVPDRLTYQGFLVDANGLALGNSAPKNYDIIFRIFNDANTGQILWSEQQTVTVDKGNFSIILGEGVAVTGESRPLLSTVFKGATASDRYIGLTVKGIGLNGANSDIMPRMRFLPNPYAFLSQQATKLVKADGTDLLSANNSAMTLDGSLTLQGSNTLELGGGVSGKEANAGKISYAGLTAGTLDIVGAGTTTANRQVKVWAEGGTTFTGTVAASSFSGDGTVPVGTIVMWSGLETTIPSGWALCNGQTSNGRATPDLRGRFLIGASATRAVGTTGGSETTTLTVAQLPAHNHTATLSISSGGSHTHPYNDHFFSSDGNPPSSSRTVFSNGENAWPGTSSGVDTNNSLWYRSMTTSSDGAHTHGGSVTIDNTGSGQSVSIMPPFYAIAFIMRVR